MARLQSSSAAAGRGRPSTSLPFAIRIRGGAAAAQGAAGTVFELIENALKALPEKQQDLSESQKAPSMSVVAIVISGKRVTYT